MFQEKKGSGLDPFKACTDDDLVSGWNASPNWEQETLEAWYNLPDSHVDIKDEAQNDGTFRWVDC